MRPRMCLPRRVPIFMPPLRVSTRIGARCEYARSAQDYAVTVLLAAEATAEQWEWARYYLAEVKELAKR